MPRLFLNGLRFNQSLETKMFKEYCKSFVSEETTRCDGRMSNDNEDANTADDVAGLNTNGCPLAWGN